jgi:3-phenylpropionate/trans-cinnamate dioxygenase ferredoxin reductase component
MIDGGMVIVGAGESGARAAIVLRQRGFEGAITLLGEESNFPYERPPLSKSAIQSPLDPLPKRILTDDQLREGGICLRTDCSVLSIDRIRRIAVCHDGSAIRYDKLLISTGCRPRKLRVEGGDQALYLRTFSDALSLRARLRELRRLVVVGAGFVGLEVAASAVARGCKVTVVEVGRRVLTRGVPEEVAKTVLAWHESKGVTFRFDTGLAAIVRAGGGLEVGLTRGQPIHCDDVLIGVGATPETTLAASCGLDLDNGVKVDETLRTSDQHIYASGDCCSFPHVLYGGRRVRLEAWRCAQEQGAVAAENMLGARESYRAVPYFWSDQYDQTLQMVGLPDEGVATIRRCLHETGDLYFHLANDGRLVAVSGVGPSGKLARDIRLAEMMIDRGVHPDPAALCSPTIHLKSWLLAR